MQSNGLFPLDTKLPGIEGLPKYMQLRQIILAAIENGFFKPGSKLPAEVEIAKATPYSLGTVQKALGDLARQGVLIRRHGLGTFVVEKMIIPLHCRFIGDEEGTLLPIYPKVLGRKLVPGKPPWGKLLGAKGRNMVEIEREIDIGHEFVVYSLFFVNNSLYPLFWDTHIQELDGANLKNIFRRNYGLEIADISYNQRMLTFPSKVCSIIGLPEKSLGLNVGILTKSADRAPLYYHELYIPPTSREFHISNYSTSVLPAH